MKRVQRHNIKPPARIPAKRRVNSPPRTVRDDGAASATSAAAAARSAAITITPKAERARRTNVKPPATISAKRRDRSPLRTVREDGAATAAGAVSEGAPIVQLCYDAEAAPLAQPAAAGASRATWPTSLVNGQSSSTASTTNSSTMARYCSIATLTTKSIARRTAAGLLKPALRRQARDAALPLAARLPAPPLAARITALPRLPPCRGLPPGHPLLPGRRLLTTARPQMAARQSNLGPQLGPTAGAHVSIHTFVPAPLTSSS